MYNYNKSGASYYRMCTSKNDLKYFWLNFIIGNISKLKETVFGFGLFFFFSFFFASTILERSSRSVTYSIS